METFYPGYRLETIIKHNEFYVALIEGDAKTPFCTHTYPINGKPADDCISVADKPFVIASYNKHGKAKAWEEVGNWNYGTAGICFIFDEPFRYWCVSPKPRDGSKRCDGYAIPFNEQEKKLIDVKRGDYLAIIDGRFKIDGTDHRVGSVLKVSNSGQMEITSTMESAMIHFKVINSNK